MKKKISRNEAIKKGLKKFFTGKKCRRGHICERYVAQGVCFLCLKETSPKYKARYRKTKKAKVVEKLQRDKWRKSKKGRISIRNINKKYHKKKYSTSPEYKIKHILRGYLNYWMVRILDRK